MCTKEILNQYIDLQKEITEVRERIERTEAQIARMEEERTVVDKVTGGEGGLQSFRIEGFPYPEYSRKKTLLYSRKAILAALEQEIADSLNNVETFISSIRESNIRRIVSLRIVDGLSWNKVADRMGGGNTEDSVKKTFYRFLEKNN